MRTSILSLEDLDISKIIWDTPYCFLVGVKYMKYNYETYEKVCKDVCVFVLRPLSFPSRGGRRQTLKAHSQV